MLRWRNGLHNCRPADRELDFAGVQPSHGLRKMRCRPVSPMRSSDELRVVAYSWFLPFCLVAAPTAQRLVGRNLVLETFAPVGIAEVDSVAECVGTFFERF